MLRLFAKTYGPRRTVTPEENVEYEQHLWNEQVTEARLNEQRQKKDYDYLENGEIEKCDDCGSYINSHGHCPKCDY